MLNPSDCDKHSTSCILNKNGDALGRPDLIAEGMIGGVERSYAASDAIRLRRARHVYQ